MPFPTRGTVLRSLAAVLLAAAAAPALAADPIAIADELVAAIEDESRDARYDNAVEANGVITITGFSFTDVQNGASGSLDMIVITNPVEREGGGFTADAVHFEKGVLTDSVNRVEFDTADAVNVVVPPAGKPLADLVAEDPIIPITAFSVDNLYFVPPQAAPLIAERFELSMGEVVDGVPYAVSVAVRGVAVPMASIDVSDPTDVIRDMGFETLLLDFDIAGSFDSDNDILILDSVGIAIRDFGRVQLSGQVSGMPLSQLAEPNGMLELMASATVDSAVLRFENAGAIERFLEAQAAASLPGTPPADVAAGLSFAARVFLRTIGNPTMEAQLSTAISAFLNRPISITAVIHPLDPLPLAALLGYALSNPSAIPGLLGISVTAND